MTRSSQKWTFPLGFTLVELLIVVVIISILAAVAMPMYGRYVKKSRTSEAISNLGAIGMYEETYYSENDTYVTCSSSPATVPSAADRGGRVAFSSAIFGWGQMGRVIPDTQMVFFQYEVRAGQYSAVAGTSNSGTYLVSPTAGVIPGGSYCTNMVSTCANGCGSGALNISNTANSNWFYATAVGDQDADHKCSIFIKIIDRPDIVQEDVVE